jgi:hypothetical protein
MNFSAFGGVEHCTDKTVPSGRSVKVSSELESLLLPEKTQAFATGSYIAVLTSSIDPTKTRPSGRTQDGASPI